MDTDLFTTLTQNRLSYNNADLRALTQQETRAKRYQALFKYHIPEEELGRIRSATHSDMALGNERFKEEIEKLTGRRVTPRKRGRKPSQMKIAPNDTKPCSTFMYQMKN